MLPKYSHVPNVATALLGAFGTYSKAPKSRKTLATCPKNLKSDNYASMGNTILPPLHMYNDVENYHDYAYQEGLLIEHNLCFYHTTPLILVEA